MKNPEVELYVWGFGNIKRITIANAKIIIEMNTKIALFPNLSNNLPVGGAKQAAIKSIQILYYILHFLFLYFHIFKCNCN